MSTTTGPNNHRWLWKWDEFGAAGCGEPVGSDR